MTIYLLKFLACSGILLLFYHFVLQGDRLFKFNRFFLLSIVVLALVIPITTVRTNYIEVPAAPTLTYEVPDLGTDSFQYAPQEEFIPKAIERSSLSSEEILAGIYILITLILLIRFGRNIYAINRLKKGCDLVEDSGIKVVLRSDISTSFSFLNYMFTNKERYEQGSLPPEIIEHEKLHIKQNHSIDIIFIEFLQCIFWFNPFIYFIRKAVKLNHEFLADAFVLGGSTSTYDYQKILLDFTEKQLLSSPLLASNLNYGFTKKRLNMMTKNTNKFKSMIKQIAAAGIITSTFWVGGETDVIAQEKEIKSELELKQTLDTKGSLNPAVPLDIKVKRPIQDTLRQIAPPKIISRMSSGMNGPKYGVSGLRANNRVRFRNASGQLVEKKASELTETEKKTFLYPEAETEWYRIAPPVRKLKQEHLDDFLSPTKYGVWLNDKQVENKVLANYKPEDIHHYTKSTLAKNAKNYGKHTFQVGLTTVEYAKTKPYFQNGWVPFNAQWRFSVKRPDIFEGSPNIYGQAWIRPNSTVRYTNKAGELVENTFNAIEKSERKWLEHPDRKVEILLPAVKKSEFSQAVLDKYQDTKKYGVWVDDKKINNKELMNYSINDFHHSSVYWLSNKSQEEKGYSYQVLFYTDDGAAKLPSANDRWIPADVQYIIIQYIEASDN